MFLFDPRWLILYLVTGVQWIDAFHPFVPLGKYAWHRLTWRVPFTKLLSFKSVAI